MKEQDLDRLLEQERPDGAEQEAEKNFQKKVRKTMNRVLYHRIFVTLLVIALAGTAVLFGLSAAMNAMFYDPGDESGFLEDDLEGSEFQLLLEETYAMYYPGQRCMVRRNGNGKCYTSTGFAGYDMDVQIESAFDKLLVGGPSTDTFHIRFSRLDTGMAPLYIYLDEFIRPENRDGIRPEQVREDVEALPDSALLDVSISLEDYLTAEQTAQLLHEYPDVFFQWAALKDHESHYCSQIAGGMNLNTYGRFRFAPEVRERYAGYYLPAAQKEITGKDLEQSLLARLRLLADHPDFVRMMENRLHTQISVEMVEERLALAERDGWSCYGLRMEVSRKDLLDMMDRLPITQIMVNDVKLSRFQRS